MIDIEDLDTDLGDVDPDGSGDPEADLDATEPDADLSDPALDDSDSDPPTTGPQLDAAQLKIDAAAKLRDAAIAKTRADGKAQKLDKAVISERVRVIRQTFAADVKRIRKEADAARTTPFRPSPVAWENGLIFDYGRGGRTVRRCSTNLTKAFQTAPEFRDALAFDELSQQIVTTRRIRLVSAGSSIPDELGEPCGMGRFTLLDEDVFPIQLWLEAHGFPSFPEGTIWAALVHAARKNRFHPVVDYLEDCYAKHAGPMSLDRARDIVGGFLPKYLGAKDTPVNRAKSSIMLLSAVARVLPAKVNRPRMSFVRPDAETARLEPNRFGPGCLVKLVVVLHGLQNRGKSYAVSALCPDPTLHSEEQLDFSDTKSSGEKTTGKWLMEYPEFDDALLSGRASESACKAFVSRRIDRWRPAYAKAARDFRRQAIIIGTTNRDDWMIDLTGYDVLNRYLPVRCAESWGPTQVVNARAIQEARDEIWAAAVVCYAAGDVWWVAPSDQDTQTQMIEEQRDFRPESMHTVRIKRFLDQPMACAPFVRLWPCPDHIPTSVIVDALFKDQRGPNVSQQIIAASMRELGWRKDENKRVIAGHRIRCWNRPETAEHLCDASCASLGADVDVGCSGWHTSALSSNQVDAASPGGGGRGRASAEADFPY